MPLYSREEGQVIIVNEDTRSDDVSQDEANSQDKAEDFCLPSEIKNNIKPRQRSKQFFFFYLTISKAENLAETAFTNPSQNHNLERARGASV